MSDRRAQWESRRLEKRRAKRVAKEENQCSNAPRRIRGAARACFVFGFLAIFGGASINSDTPVFGDDAYTEIVRQTAEVGAGIAWLAAVVLFVGGALLKALADVLDELRRSAAIISAR